MEKPDHDHHQIQRTRKREPLERVEIGSWFSINLQTGTPYYADVGFRAHEPTRLTGKELRAVAAVCLEAAGELDERRGPVPRP